MLRFVLTQPPDRVSYRMLNPSDDEMARVRDMGIEAGILTKRIPIRDLVDRSFIPSDIAPAAIDMGRN